MGLHFISVKSACYLYLCYILMGDGTMGGGGYYRTFEWAICFIFPLNLYQKPIRYVVEISFGEKNEKKTLRVWCHVTSKSAVVDPHHCPIT